MRNWNYGINSLLETAHICLEEGPAWCWWLDDIASRICYWIPDWLGHNYFHLYVCSPIFQFCESKKTVYTIDLGWDKTKAMFYESNKTFWDDQESWDEFGDNIEV